VESGGCSGAKKDVELAGVRRDGQGGAGPAEGELGAGRGDEVRGSAPAEGGVDGAVRPAGKQGGVRRTWGRKPNVSRL
jgi:hypothetical protein